MPSSAAESTSASVSNALSTLTLELRWGARSVNIRRAVSARAALTART
jgi:hypothetical protein